MPRPNGFDVKFNVITFVHVWHCFSHMVKNSKLMLKNYLQIAWRTLRKNIVFSYINIFGLAIGMAAFLFIAQYIRFERSYENFHTNADNIFRIATEFYNGSEYVMTDCETFAPLGPLLKEKLPEVIDFA